MFHILRESTIFDDEDHFINLDNYICNIPMYNTFCNVLLLTTPRISLHQRNERAHGALIAYFNDTFIMIRNDSD